MVEAAAEQRRRRNELHPPMELLKHLAHLEKPRLTVVVPTADLSLEGRTFNSNSPPLEKTIAALKTFGIRFSYDRLRDRYQVGDYAMQQQFGESIDAAILVLRTAIMQRFGFDPKDYTEAAVRRLCLENAFNPLVDYLDHLEWDGKPRIDTWLTTYLGAEDGQLNRAFGRKVLVAAVRRATTPGTKFDQMLVLEGEQGTGKSSALKILAGDYFSDAEILGKGGREVQELCSGVWVYEISELVGLGKRDVEHVKAFLSRTHDKARPAWGRVTVERGRTCIIIGTCNRNDYLADETGNRRFWPVVTGRIDLDGLKRDRDQLWAEASVAEKTGETLTIEPALWSSAAKLTEERVAKDPWVDLLARVEHVPTASGSIGRVDGEIRVSSDFLLTGVLQINPARQHITHEKRVASAMKQLGWGGPKTMRIPGGTNPVKGYVKKASE
jgi:predicted P-loop ATPase